MSGANESSLDIPRDNTMESDVSTGQTNGKGHRKRGGKSIKHLEALAAEHPRAIGVDLPDNIGIGAEPIQIGKKTGEEVPKNKKKRKGERQILKMIMDEDGNAIPVYKKKRELSNWQKFVRTECGGKKFAEGRTESRGHFSGLGPKYKEWKAAQTAQEATA